MVEEISFEQWLRDLRLDEYIDRFKEMGATSLDDLKDMRESDLDQLANELNMRFVQRSKFKKAVAELNRVDGGSTLSIRSARSARSRGSAHSGGAASAPDFAASAGVGNVIVLTEKERQAMTDFGNKIEQVEGTLSRIDDHVLLLTQEAKRQSEKIKRAFALLRRELEARERELSQRVENDKSEKVGELTKQRATLVSVLSSTKQSQQQAESLLRGAVTFASMDERAEHVLSMADKTKRGVERALASMGEVDTRILPSLSLDASDQITQVIKQYGEPGSGRFELRQTFAGSIDDLASHVAPSVVAFRYNQERQAENRRQQELNKAPPRRDQYEETGTRISSGPPVSQQSRSNRPQRRGPRAGPKRVKSSRFPTAAPSEVSDGQSGLGAGGATRNNFRRGGGGSGGRRGNRNF